MSSPWPFTAGYTPGSETVTATVAGASGHTALTVVGDAPARVVLGMVPGSLQVGAAATVTGRVYDAGGHPLGGITVDLAATAGTLGSASVTTDPSGGFTAAYTAPRSSGNVWLGASIPGTLISGTDEMTILAGQAAALTIDLSPASVTAGGTVSVSGSVSDSHGNPVGGAAVRLSGSAGFPAQTVSTDLYGQYTADFTAPGTTGPVLLTVAVPALGLDQQAMLAVSAARGHATGYSVVFGTGGVTTGGPGSGTPGVTVTATGGSGGVAVVHYAADPVTTPPPSGTSSFFDVGLTPNSTFGSVTITECNLGVAHTAYWWDASAGSWREAEPQSWTGGCLVIGPLDATSSPTLAQLNGTPFVVVIPASSVVIHLGVGPAGGTLVTPDGAFSMPMAAGAVPAGAALTVSEAFALPSAAPAGMVQASPVFTVHGVALSQPQVATFRTNPAALGGLSTNRLSVYEQTADGSWTFLPTATGADGTVSAYLSGPGTYTVLAATTVFSDVPSGYWASGAIDALLAAGVVDGLPGGTFQPNGPLSRAELVKMLDITLGLSPQTGSTAFTDVPAGAWYAPYVEAAVEAALVDGITPTTFGPQAGASREQVAVLLTRGLHLTGSAALPFSDAGQIAPWATAGVRAAVGAGLLQGFPDGTLQPAALLTRAQVAEILARVIAHRAP